MIIIRDLTASDMQQAIELKVLCWTEELAGKAENTLSVSEELNSWLAWMNAAEENNDIRQLIGAFEDDKMLAVAIGSFAETNDIPDKGIELNGLWVYPEQRGRGISLKLITHLLDFYLEKGMKSMVIYNHHYASSNEFYKKFGAEVVAQVHQMSGKLLIDIFKVDMMLLKKTLKKSLIKYN